MRAALQHRVIDDEGRILHLRRIRRFGVEAASVIVGLEHAVPAVLAATHNPVDLDQVFAGAVEAYHDAAARVGILAKEREVVSGHRHLQL